MVDIKKQKIHPSTYGRWEKISHIPRKKTSSPQAEATTAAVDDVDLKKLDEILSSTEKSTVEHTYDEDDNLESLNSMISGIRKRQTEGTASSSEEKPDSQEERDEPDVEDVLNLLKEHAPLDLKKLDQQLFGIVKDDTADQNIEETEDEYLQALEKRYKKKEH